MRERENPAWDDDESEWEYRDLDDTGPEEPPCYACNGSCTGHCTESAETTSGTPYSDVPFLRALKAGYSVEPPF